MEVAVNFKATGAVHIIQVAPEDTVAQLKHKVLRAATTPPCTAATPTSPATTNNPFVFNRAALTLHMRGEGSSLGDDASRVEETLLHSGAAVDACFGPAVQAPHCYPRSASCLAISACGTRLLVGERAQGGLSLWDTEHATPEWHTTSPHDALVTGVCLSPCGAWAASSDEHLGVTISHADCGRRRHVLEGHAAYVFSLAFTPCSRRLVTGSEDCTIRVWDHVRGQSLLVIRAAPDRISCVGVTDSLVVASCSRAAHLTVWGVRRGECAGRLVGHSGTVDHVAVGSDGLTAVSCSLGGAEVKVWSLRSLRCLRALRCQHRPAVRRLALSACGRYVVGQGRCAGTAVVWDRTTGACNDLSSEATTDHVGDIAVTPCGKWLFRALLTHVDVVPINAE